MKSKTVVLFLIFQEFVISVMAGKTTSGDTDNDTASNARFNTPYGISSDGTYIYVGDFGNNKVRRIE